MLQIGWFLFYIAALAILSNRNGILLLFSELCTQVFVMYAKAVIIGHISRSWFEASLSADIRLMPSFYGKKSY